MHVMCMCVCLSSVCVCVRERERESAYMYICILAHHMLLFYVSVPISAVGLLFFVCLFFQSVNETVWNVLPV